MLINPVQPAKIDRPMLVTVLGITMLSKLEQSRKAPRPIETMPG